MEQQEHQLVRQHRQQRAAAAAAPNRHQRLDHSTLSPGPSTMIRRTPQRRHEQPIAEHLNAAVADVDDDDVSTRRIDSDARRGLKLAFGLALLAELEQESALLVECLNAMTLVVGDEDVSVRWINRDARRAKSLAIG